MAAITFTEIMNCYPDNKMVYKHIKRDCGELIPFVGAGLSVPCYPLWTKALKDLAEQVAVPETKSDILEMIEGENPQLLEAAQALEDYWGQRGMAYTEIAAAGHCHLSLLKSTKHSADKIVTGAETRVHPLRVQPLFRYSVPTTCISQGKVIS